jgi:anaerobic magnesium-protoporphyrin IX monomethyl ester cyclase
LIWIFSDRYTSTGILIPYYPPKRPREIGGFEMSQKVLLIFPRFGTEKTKPERPPLGILTVAAPLVEIGVDVSVLDERVETDFDNLLQVELAKNPICVGISSMSGRHIAQALRISKFVKENSECPVVWGGVHASLEPKTTIEHELIDIIVRDDGEETFPRLLDSLESNRADLGKIKGIAFKDNGKVIFTDPPQPADIAKLPPIPFNLIDFEKYGPEPGTLDYDWISDPKKIIPMETSRGCPFSCIFCTESVRKTKWRSLPPERVISDLEIYIEKYGIRNFTFIDDNIFGNLKRGKELISLLAKTKLGINWYSNIRSQ